MIATIDIQENRRRYRISDKNRKRIAEMGAELVISLFPGFATSRDTGYDFSLREPNGAELTYERVSFNHIALEGYTFDEIVTEMLSRVRRG